MVLWGAGGGRGVFGSMSVILEYVQNVYAVILIIKVFIVKHIWLYHI